MKRTRGEAVGSKITVGPTANVHDQRCRRARTAPTIGTDRNSLQLTYDISGLLKRKAPTFRLGEPVISSPSPFLVQPHRLNEPTEKSLLLLLRFQHGL